MSGPLSGVKVIDFTHVLAGPACGFYLGLLGADVIKVEGQRRGDAMRYRGGSDPAASSVGMSTAYLAQGGGKRSVNLDLDSDQGRLSMQRLLSSADVFLENHRPKTIRNLGLDEDSTQVAHPHLIHCSMTGYGRGGPLENAPAYDVNVQAACGIMTLTGTQDTGPLRTGAPIMDYSVALAAGFAISAALYDRERSGKGAFIDVSMLETGLCLMASTIVDYLATGSEPRAQGNAANSRSPTAGSFSCRTGVLSLGVNEEKQFERLAYVLGRGDWLIDPRFSKRSVRMQNYEELKFQISKILLQHDADYWETLLLDNSIPAAKVRTLPECLSMPQVIERDFLLRAEEGAELVPTLPFRFRSFGKFQLIRKSPPHGEHTGEILSGVDR